QAAHGAAARALRRAAMGASRRLARRLEPAGLTGACGVLPHGAALAGAQAENGMSKETHRLPGDPSRTEDVARMIRVDHAGEYGAARIYEGQLAVLGRSASAPVIRRMAEQEKRHLAAFDSLVVDRRVRPTLLSPLWHAAGFALGAATALLGERAAMACTVAVEEVIDEHYRDQVDRLGETEPELRNAITEFRA